jgi:hypothetical protein
VISTDTQLPAAEYASSLRAEVRRRFEQPASWIDNSNMDLSTETDPISTKGRYNDSAIRRGGKHVHATEPTWYGHDNSLACGG